MSEPNREAVEAAANEIDRKTALVFIDLVRRQDKEGLPYFQADWLVDLYVGALDRERAAVRAEAALPFLAPQPTQSDEKRATEALFGAERGIHVGNRERDLYAISFAALLRALAVVRAEATLAGAVAERAQNAALLRARASELEGSHKLIMLGAADEIKARKP